MEGVQQKLKDTLSTILTGGKFVFDFFKNGFNNFIANFMEEHSFKLPKILGVQVSLPGIGSTIPNPLALYNPMVVAPLLIKSFFGKKDEGQTTSSSTTVANTISANQETFGGKGGSTYKNAEAVAKETTYESGEGNAVIIPVPIPETKQVAIKNSRGRTVRYKTVVIDDSELAMYGGK